VTYPVSSADRDEAYVSYAPSTAPPSPSLHSPDCDGWVGEDDEGRPIPCLDEKCHKFHKGLTDRLRRQRRRRRRYALVRRGAASDGLRGRCRPAG
jgi:hypothetical protein